MNTFSVDIAIRSQNAYLQLTRTKFNWRYWKYEFHVDSWSQKYYYSVYTYKLIVFSFTRSFPYIPQDTHINIKVPCYSMTLNSWQSQHLLQFLINYSLIMFICQSARSCNPGINGREPAGRQRPRTTSSSDPQAKTWRGLRLFFCWRNTHHCIYESSSNVTEWPLLCESITPTSASLKSTKWILQYFRSIYPYFFRKMCISIFIFTLSVISRRRLASE